MGQLTKPVVDFINISMNVTYGPGPISYTVQCMHCFQNALAYFPTDVSYECKMFMKWTPGLKLQL
jgi:hypothetical protein